MKIIPILTAGIVLVALYFLVLDRDALQRFAATTPLSTTDAPAETASAEPLPAPAATETDDPARAVSVVVLASTAQNIEDGIVLRGRTEAARDVTAAAETSGTVISEPLRRGAFVNAGDLLCELDPGTRASSLAEARARLTEAQGRVPEAMAAVAEAEARIREAEINVNAARQLSEGGFATETRLVSAEAVVEAAQAGLQRANSGVASAEAGIESAQAAVAVAEREMERLRITAPFDGLLETDTAELGALMQPGTPCATIIQLDPIKLVGFVPEADVDRIDLGSPAGARLATGAEVAGRVTFVSRSADEMTRTFAVEVTVPNPDLAIRDGQTVEILVGTNGQLAHLIPQSALTLDDAGTLGVRVVTDGNIAGFQPVTLLRDTVDGVWVSDLPETADIIIVGQEYVIDGVAVDPTYSEAEG